VFKRSARYFTLALTLVALAASSRIAPAQSSDPCTDPGTGCVVGGTDPQPTVVGGGSTSNVVGGTDPQPTADGSDDSLNNLIVVLLFYYGLS